jgi:hypothetical protein
MAFADPVVVLPPVAPLVVVTPVRSVPLVVGPATTGGTGSAGEVTFWVTSATMAGDPAFLWDATNQQLSITTAEHLGGVAVTATGSGATAITGAAPGSAGTGVFGQAGDVDGDGVWGDSTAGVGALGTTGTGVGINGQATASGGVAVRADTTHTAAIGAQIKMPSGASANALEGYLNNVLTWSVSAAGAFVGIVRLGWRVGGTLIGTRAHLNLIAGSGITLTPVDQSGTDAVDVTVAALPPAWATLAKFGGI